ncbi:hypothetical protein [Amycolatopsis sp. lyj-90]|uniref:hypothetical protein n=1 Tax=Amycolatopsis sp. lyj-90 TaxID=2789285 RepID=UPI00397D93CB
MFEVGEPLIESEIGVREARIKLKELTEDVELRNRVVHLTRRGKRIGAIVSSDVAEGIVAIRGVEGPVVPGDLPAAIRLVESLLAGDTDDSPSLESTEDNRHALVGACLSLVDIMLPGRALYHGKLPLIDSDGSKEIKFVADLLVRKLFKRFNVDAVACEFPLVAGALWAAQAQESAVEYRLQIPVGISSAESVIWVFALWELCQLINAIHGEGVAEELMYNTEEFLRDEASSTNFD